VLRAAYPAETAAALQARLQQGVSVTDARNSIVKPRLDLLRALGAVNDAFAAGPVIAGAAASYSVETASATAQAGEPAHAGVPATRSVWWSWTAPADGLLTLDTAGSSFDTVLAVYTGTAVGALVPVAANNDSGAAGGASALTVAVTAGTTYRIVVDAATGTGGTARLTLGFAPAPPPPDNDADVPLPPAAWALLALLLAGGGAARLRRR
jgi:hypothetical protein